MTTNERKIVQFLLATFGHPVKIGKMAKDLKIPADEAAQIMDQIMTDVQEESDGGTVNRRSQKSTVQ